MSNEPKHWVLIVEPDRILASSLCAAVVAARYEAIDARDGESALKLVFSGVVFHSILVAFHLPRMSGADFCAVYRGRQDFPSANLIGMSRDHRREAEMVAAGADQFLNKPFPMTALRTALEGSPAGGGEDLGR